MPIVLSLAGDVNGFNSGASRLPLSGSESMRTRSGPATLGPLAHAA